MNMLKNRGFNLFELLITIGILLLITMIIIPKLIDFQREQAIKNTTENIISLLSKAKSDSSSSLNSSNYGVHFTSSSIIYFIGDTFTESDPNNRQIDFESEVTTISGGIALNGGGNDIIFPRLTGDVVGYGTITIHLTSVPEREKTITVTKTGSISSN